MADNESDAPPVFKGNRKRKLTDAEKVEKSNKNKVQREARRNEKKRKTPSSASSSSAAGTRTYTYGTGISDGPRKPYQRKVSADDGNHTAALEETEIPAISSVVPNGGTELMGIVVYTEPTMEHTGPQPTNEPLSIEIVRLPQADSSSAGKTSRPAVVKLKEDPVTAWMANEDIIYGSFVNSHTVNQSICGDCKTSCQNGIIKCMNCCRYLCPACDRKRHSDPYHTRSFFRPDFTSKVLLPIEFVNSKGIIKEERINVPMFPPSSCACCGSEGTSCVIPSTTSCYLVTKKGRLDLSLPVFHCESCNNRTEPTIEDYIGSGFWPGSPNRFTILFHQDVLEFWYHLRFLTPGTSEQKFLECLCTLSFKYERTAIIDKKMFSEASKAYDYFNHLIDKRIKNIDKTKCRACVDCVTGEPECLACHIDGNFKLLKHCIENEAERKSYFGNEIIRDDSELNTIMEEVNAVKPRIQKQKGMCGNSEFKAAQEVASQRKSLTVAGNMMGSCGHATILTSVDMKESETYRHTLLLTKEVLEKRNCKFLVNDVVCHFWVFLANLAMLLPKAYGAFTTRLTPFLSRLHGQAHAWFCQVIYFGHWRDGACGTLGEEQEQVFSVFSRYSNVTKYMSRSVRNDFLSLAMFYWNARKEIGLPHALTKRLLTAYYRVTFYSKSLEDKLMARGMQDDSQLMTIQKNLESEARAHLASNKNTPSRILIEKERRSLVGTHLEWVSLSDRIATVANSCKWRNKLVGKRRKLELKAQDLMKQINESMKEGAEKVTIHHFTKGVFPWDQANKASFQEDFKLVDTWNLKKRNEECIIQTKKEMKNFLYSVANDLKKISDEMDKLKNSLGSRCSGELAIKSKEHSRLVQLMRDALSYYKYFGREDDLNYLWFSALVRQSDDRDVDFILNEQSILLNDVDEEDFSSEDEEN